MNAKNASIFLFIFYAVGILGFLIPFSHAYFISLTKWALILNLFLLILFHQNRISYKSMGIFLLIFFSSFIIEVIGVNTGVIFGVYNYGDGLGIKVANTPLLIGMNWLMLSYSIAVVLNPIKQAVWAKVLLGASGMLLYDLILEQSAGNLHMWFWENNQIPFQNYAAWFIVAVLMQMILYASKEKFNNQLALPTLISQGVFFLTLGLFKLLGL